MGTMSCYEVAPQPVDGHRQAAVVAIVLAATLASCYVTEPHLGLVGSLAIGLIAWTAVFLPITFHQWAHVPPAPLPEAARG